MKFSFRKPGVTIQAMGRTKILTSETYLLISVSLRSNPDVQLFTVNPGIVRPKFFYHAFPYGSHLGLSVFCTLWPLPSLILLFVLAGAFQPPPELPPVFLFPPTFQIVPSLAPRSWSSFVSHFLLTSLRTQVLN